MAGSVNFKGIAPMEVTNTVTLDQNGATNLAVFTLPAFPVHVTKLYGIVTEATDATSCTAVYFDLYDATNAVALTKNDGVLTSMAVGTYFIKNAVATTTMDIMNADQVRMDETIESTFYAFTLVPKTGAVNQIRLNYTGATGFDMDVKLFLEYYTLGSTDQIEAI